MNDMWKSLAFSLLNRALSILLGETWQFIKDSVAKYQQTDLTGEQKRAAVILDAYTHLKNSGLQISASLVNLGIESAVQKFHANNERRG